LCFEIMFLKKGEKKEEKVTELFDDVLIQPFHCPRIGS